MLYQPPTICYAFVNERAIYMKDLQLYFGSKKLNIRYKHTIFNMAANLKYKFRIFSLILRKVSMSFYNTNYSCMFKSLLILELYLLSALI